MKKIDWKTIAIIFSILCSIIFGSVKFGKLEQKVDNNIEWRQEQVQVTRDLIKEVRLLRKEVQETRFEIELNRLRNEK